MVVAQKTLSSNDQQISSLYIYVRLFFCDILVLVMKRSPIHIIGAAYGLGSSKHGAWRGPSALRAAGVVTRLRALGLELVDDGDIVEPDLPGGSQSSPVLKNLEPFLSFHEELSARLLSSYDDGGFPLILGGDHAISISTISSAYCALKKRDPKAEIGLLWVDTHPDVNTTETTPSGNIHGMSVAALLGQGDSRLTSLCAATPKLKPENIAYLGLRDIDPGERELIRSLSLKTFTMSDVDVMGIADAAAEAIKHVTKNTSHVIVSFDLDVCDPSIAPGVGTPYRGGLTFREARSVMEQIAEIPSLASLELVELNPELDINGMTCHLGLDLLESAFGRRFL